MSILILRLEGPLQSWGEHSVYYQEGDTATMPTKSGIVGLLACALGISKEESAEIAALSDALTIGIRADRPGKILIDFQTTSAKRLQTAEHGTRKEKKSTICAHKQYLEDAAFTVALTSNDESLLKHLADALQHPSWSIFLGRKSCVPTRPVFESLLDGNSLLDALKTVPVLPQRPTKEPAKTLTVELEESIPHGVGLFRQDIPSERSRYFYSRLVHRIQIPIPIGA